MKKVQFVELTGYEKVTPLVSGYLQSYALLDPVLRGEYAFDIYSVSVRTEQEKIIQALVAADADVYAFSCYLWNMKLVKRVLAALIRARPRAQIIVGGPQVMNHAAEHLRDELESVVICNGEGEKTFSSYLTELLHPQPDFARVRGLSFVRDGSIVTTEKEERFKELDQIPSPYLSGVFDKLQVGYALLETNRGCPFRCGFCFWGAATNDRVYKFSEERIRDELSWISERGFAALQLVDSNWGMLERDVALTQHLVDCKQKYGSPALIYFSSAKNKPERVTEITKVLVNGGLSTPQPLSLQSLSDDTLKQIDRKNIKLSAYTSVQQSLSDTPVSTYTELIWPLPGETLESFKEGVAKLCETQAECLTVYPHLLLHNTDLYRRREQLKLVTRPVEDDVADAEVVVATAEVSEAETREGTWYYYAVHVLHNARALHASSAYLNNHGIASYKAVFSSFVEFCKRRQDFPLSQFIRRSVDDLGCYDLFNDGRIVHFVMHEGRAAMDDFLFEFVSDRGWLSTDAARTMFELDLLNRPMLYCNTPMVPPREELLQAFELTGTSGRAYTVRLRNDCTPLLRGYVKLAGGEASAQRGFRIDHDREQLPYVEAKNHDQILRYAHSVVQRIKAITPTWSVQRPAARLFTLARP